MEAMAKALSPRDMADFATYYAQLDAPAAKIGSATEISAEQMERVRLLALKGSHERPVQACLNCHGPNGAGEPPTIPYLSGLDAGYLIAAMNAWKDGSRKNDAGQQMATVVQPMTADDIAAVAHYYASLPPPKPTPPDIVTPPASPKLPTPASAPQNGNRPRNGQEGGASPTGKTVLANLPSQAGAPARGRAIVASGVHGCRSCHHCALAKILSRISAAAPATQ
jgi:cytochrome c553